MGNGNTLQVRDKRANNRYFVDNAFLRGGWGKKLGPHAIAVYNAIVMHADNETQIAYPSHKKIANLTGMSSRQVSRELEKLAKYRIVHIESRAEERKPSLITLLDENEWIPPDDTTDRHMTESHMSHSQQTTDSQSDEHMTGSHTNNTHGNKTKGTKPKEGAAEKTPPARNYLTDVFNAHINGLDPGVADPSQDIAQYMQYADDFLKTYHKRTGLHADSHVQKPAIQAIAIQPNANLDLWDQVITAWVKHGWNKRNVAGMIECYERGEVPSTNGGKTNGPHRRIQSGDDKNRYANLTPEQRQKLGV